jgi:hypothetical protein
MGETIKFPKSRRVEPSTGTAGLKTQLPGMGATVSNLAAAGGIGGKGIVNRDVK